MPRKGEQPLATRRLGRERLSSQFRNARFQQQDDDLLSVVPEEDGVGEEERNEEETEETRQSLSSLHAGQSYTSRSDSDNFHGINDNHSGCEDDGLPTVPEHQSQPWMSPGALQAIHDSLINPALLDAIEPGRNISHIDLQLAEQFEALASLASPDDAFDDLPTEQFQDDAECLPDNMTTARAADMETGSSPNVCSTERLANDTYLTTGQIELPDGLEDGGSQPVNHKRSAAALSPYRIALGIWAEQFGISRAAFTPLLEIMKMDEHSVEVHNLPSDVTTLKRQVAENLPLLQMRKKAINLAENQQSWYKKTEDLHFFDAIALFPRMASSPVIKKQLHLDLGHFVDNPTELWHSNSWMSSVRTTSGHFGHYASTNAPIFPSDFVLFFCADESCSCINEESRHLGRVKRVGREFRSSVDVVFHGKIMIEVQLVIRQSERSLHQIPASAQLLPGEGMLSWKDVFLLPESHIISRFEDCKLDYTFGDQVLQRHSTLAPSPSMGNGILVRQMLIEEGNDASLHPICRSHPIRGELEIAEFGRAKLERLDTLSTGTKTISIPIPLFLDGFGLYSRTYRSQMGIYAIPAGLPGQDRLRRANCFPLTIGPHGSDLQEVIDSIKRYAIIDQGLNIRISTDSSMADREQGGETVFVCAPILAFLGDMPQQNANSGIKSQRATTGCRFCYVKAGERDNLAFDIDSKGRYHHQTIMLREKMNSLPVTARRDMGTELGLSEGEPPLLKIAPALDIILTRPHDVAHSEYHGLTKLMHTSLVKDILTSSAADEYAAQLRRFPFPPMWPRVQGPLHHLKSYSMSDHGRWSIVIVPLLRCFLTDSHLQPRLKSQLAARGYSPVSWILSCFANAARSNCLLMGVPTANEQSRQADTLLQHRNSFQELMRLIGAAKGPSRARTRQRQSSIASAISSRAVSPAARVADSEESAAHPDEGDVRRPNMHMGVHFSAMIEEYGPMVNLSTLIGEDKHRFFKKIILRSNKLNAHKDLLHAENIRQTIRLLLANAYQHEEPELTTLLHTLYERCPLLFSSILPKSERGEYSIETMEAQDEDEEGSPTMSSNTHLAVSTLGKIRASYCASHLHLPNRGGQMDEGFKAALREGYGCEYGMPNIVSFGNTAIAWVKKVSFTSPIVQQRLTFKRGNFFRANRNNVDHTMQIEHIMIHRLGDQRRLFLKARVVHTTGLGVDPVLGEGYDHWEVSNDGIYWLIGLPALVAEHLYVVPIESSNSSRLSLGNEDSLRFLAVRKTLIWL